MSAQDVEAKRQNAYEKLRAAFVAYLEYQKADLREGECGGDFDTFLDWVRDEKADLEALQKRTEVVERSLDNAYRDRRRE